MINSEVMQWVYVGGIYLFLGWFLRFLRMDPKEHVDRLEKRKKK